MPAAEPVHDRLDVPPPGICVTLRVQARLLELVMTDRATVPMNPFVGLIVMVDVPATPALRVRVEELALMSKSAAVT